MNARILIIDDDADICTLLQRYLSRQGFDTDITYSAKNILNKFKEKKYDVVLCDYRLRDMEGIDVLTTIKEAHPQISVVIMTGYSDVKTAVNVIKRGAYDYITKPLVPEDLLSILKNALKSGGKKGEVDKAKPEKKAPLNASVNEKYLVGKSSEIKELYRQVDIVAPTNFSVILYGESGSGKEVIAKIIHKKSRRHNGPFVALDCGTLSKELANSELFGHIKGSFTGAYSDKKGHFELANNGTLFLDEVANLSYDIQAALLRVIQERKMKRIGDTKEIDLDIRIIVASHENLKDAYKKGLFREDLFHRLNEFNLHIPPLRNRKKDIPLFVNYFLEKTNKELDKNIIGIDEEVINLFNNYTWPGNLREFRNVIRKAVLMASSETLTVHSLPKEFKDAIQYDPPDQKSTLTSMGTTSSLKKMSSEVEFQTIIEVLKSVNFNKSKAAKVLNIDRKTLYNKLRNHES